MRHLLAVLVLLSGAAWFLASASVPHVALGSDDAEDADPEDAVFDAHCSVELRSQGEAVVTVEYRAGAGTLSDGDDVERPFVEVRPTGETAAFDLPASPGDTSSVTVETPDAVAVVVVLVETSDGETTEVDWFADPCESARSVVGESVRAASSTSRCETERPADPSPEVASETRGHNAYTWVGDIGPT